MQIYTRVAHNICTSTTPLHLLFCLQYTFSLAMSCSGSFPEGSYPFPIAAPKRRVLLGADTVPHLQDIARVYSFFDGCKAAVILCTPE